MFKNCVELFGSRAIVWSWPNVTVCFVGDIVIVFGSASCISTCNLF
jgi:hypothetical protein